MSKVFTCIVCPIGCQIVVDNGKISGNKCLRGLEYVKTELIDPKRVLTTIVKTTSKITPVISVKTDGAIPKSLILEVLKLIKNIVIDKTTNMGDVIIENVLNTGINVVATKKVTI